MTETIERAHRTQEGYRAPLISLVSASGGVGKSTVALLLAHAAAQQIIKTALVEADLQFGDMGFWLGLDVASPSLSLGASCQGIPIAPHLDLYKAPPLPEVAEEISDSAAELVARIRKDYALVIADTGQFWSGLTGELLCSSDLILLVMDQRKTSVYGAVKALELCQRLNIPTARIACVMNRATGMPKGELEKIQNALNCGKLYLLADGKAYVESLVSTARIEELVEGEGTPLPDVHRLLADLLPRVGIDFKPAAPKKSRRFFL